MSDGHKGLPGRTEKRSQIRDRLNAIGGAHGGAESLLLRAAAMRETVYARAAPTATTATASCQITPALVAHTEERTFARRASVSARRVAASFRKRMRSASANSF